MLCRSDVIDARKSCVVWCCSSFAKVGEENLVYTCCIGVYLRGSFFLDNQRYKSSLMGFTCGKPALASMGGSKC